MKRLFITVFVFLVLVSGLAAAQYESFMNVVGVDNEGKGIVGNVTVEIQPGKGRVLVDTMPFQGIYTQDSERIAVKIASDITGFDFSNYDVIYSIVTSNAHVIDGPSAGGALALSTIAAIEQKPISKNFAMTGTIEDDGSIGDVGEILAKAKAAADHGVTVFLIPEGQATQNQYVRKVKTSQPGWHIETIEPVRVNIADYAKDNWGMDVYEVSDIREAMKYAFGEIPETKQTPVLQPTYNATLPKFSSPVTDYKDFSNIVQNDLSIAEGEYTKVSKKLDATVLPDDIRAVLDELMIRSKIYLDNGKEIDGRGYAYSTANEAFRSSITTNVVEDLINYYSSSDRIGYLETRIKQTNEKINQTSSKVSSRIEKSICDPENFEWAVAASQRVTYAENRMKTAEVPEELTNDFIPVELFYKISTAEQWIEISERFLQKGIIRTAGTECLEKFKDQAQATITEAENQIILEKGMGYEDVEDAVWYLDAAKTEFRKGWYISSIYDAASAKIRARVGSTYDSKSIEDIYSKFNETDTVTQDLIGTIFLENSYYQIYRAVKDDSVDDAILGVQILALAKETNQVYSDVKGRMGEPKFSWAIDWKFEIKPEDYVNVLLVLVCALTIYVVYLSFKVRRLERKVRVRQRQH